MADLSRSGRPVVHHDQLGNGNSTHLARSGADFWTVDLFLDELDNLLDKLGIASAYHLLGQSWGGMLAAEHAVHTSVVKSATTSAEQSPTRTFAVSSGIPRWVECPFGQDARSKMEVLQTSSLFQLANGERVRTQ